MKKKINVAVIGLGNRARGVVKQLLEDSKHNVKVVSGYDPDRKLGQEMLRFWGGDGILCDSPEAAIRTSGVDWVMVFSPNAYHKEHILAAFAAGKNVFSEKPLATSIRDCKAIYDAWKKSGRTFVTGFVLRYAMMYRKAKEILDSGKLGKILAIDADEHIRPEHGGYIMSNWRRHTAVSGPHILEKCCHDLDLINWFCQSLPSKVAAFAGCDFFTPANAAMLKKYGAKTFLTWNNPHGNGNPFSGDSDLMDILNGIIQYRNGIRVSFSCTMCNPVPERRMRFNCTEGNLVLELYSGKLLYGKLGSEEVVSVNIPGDGHGGGDQFIMKELYATMTKGTPPKCAGDEGLNSAVLAMALDQAAREGKIIDLEPVWKKLDR